MSSDDTTTSEEASVMSLCGASAPWPGDCRDEIALVLHGYFAVVLLLMLPCGGGHTVSYVLAALSITL